MSYHHKSGAQKRREKAMRTEGVLNEEDLVEIEEEPEEVPRSEPDIDAAGCSGWTCYAQSVDLRKPGIVLRKPWIHGLWYKPWIGRAILGLLAQS